MTRWQYAHLTIDIDVRRPHDEPPAVVQWHEPGQEANPITNCSDGPVVELLSRFGADGWELVSANELRSGGARNRNYWDPLESLATYTFKRPLP
jgi:hypothetical protein